MELQNVKVVKFGGTSLADAKQLLKAKAIIEADPSRRYVVPSAPGKRFSNDIKVTDMLYECYRLASEGEDFSREFSRIKDRYDTIIAELGIDLDLSADYEKIEGAFMYHAGSDYAASRGEYTVRSWQSFSVMIFLTRQR